MSRNLKNLPRQNSNSSQLHQSPKEGDYTFGDRKHAKRINNFAFGDNQHTHEPEIEEEIDDIGVQLKLIDKKVEEAFAQSRFHQEYAVIQDFLGDLSTQIILDREKRKKCFALVERKSRASNANGQMGSSNHNSRKSSASGRGPKHTVKKHTSGPTPPTSVKVSPRHSDNIIISLPKMSEGEKILVEEIKQSAGKWLESKKLEDEDEVKKDEKEIKATLNKITPDNFNDLRKDILKLVCKRESTCRSMCDIIVSKAWTEAKYTSLYSKLCEYLAEQDITFDKDDNGTKKTETPGITPRKRNDFRKMILFKLQNIFEEKEDILKSKKKVEDMSTEEKAKYMESRKKKILGNVTFLAELTTNKFLSKKIIQNCTKDLLVKFLNEYKEFKTHSTHSEMTPPHEDTLEALMKLYSKVGPSMESHSVVMNDSYKPSHMLKIVQNTLKHPESFDKDNSASVGEDLDIETLFQCFEVIKSKAEIPERLKMLIINLLEKRKKNWQESNLVVAEKPKPILELHEEYFRQQEELDNSVNKSLMSRSKRSTPKLSVFPNLTPTHTPVYTPTYSAKLPVNLSRREIDLDSSSDNLLSDLKLSRVASAMAKLVNGEDLKKSMIQVYSQMDNPETVAQELDQMMKSAPRAQVFQAFLDTFFNGSDTVVMKRVNIFQEFISHDLISEEFVQKFDEFFRGNASGNCDFPLLPKYLAKIFVEYCNGKNLNFDIWKPEIAHGTEDFEERIEFAEKIYTESKKLIAGKLDMESSLTRNIEFLQVISSLFPKS